MLVYDGQCIVDLGEVAMKSLGWMAALAAMSVAAPAVAQSGAMSDGQINFFAEMLALEQACDDLIDYNVARDDLQTWLADRLSRESDADIDAVVALRDEKLDTLIERAERVRSMSRSNRRDEAANEHIADVGTRCQRLSSHNIAGRYFNVVHYR